MTYRQTIQRINILKRWSFEKINVCKIDRSLAQFTKRKKERTQINRIRNEQGNSTTKNKEIQNIIRKYFKSLYSIKVKTQKKWMTL